MEHESLVTEHDVYWIAKTLTTSYDVVVNSNKLGGALGLLPAQIEEVRHACLFSGSGTYEILSRLITKWISIRGHRCTLAELLTVLRSERFNSAADELIKAAQKQTTRSPSPNLNSNAQPDMINTETNIIPDDFPLTENHVQRVRDQIIEDITAITKWVTIKDWFLHKSVDKYIIDEMLKDPSKIEHTILKTLQIWISREGPKATFETLVSIFDEIELKHLCSDLNGMKAVIWRNSKS